MPDGPAKKPGKKPTKGDMPLNKEIKRPSYPPSYRLNCITLFFYKDGFGIKLPMKVDVPLNTENKLNLDKQGILPKSRTNGKYL